MERFDAHFHIIDPRFPLTKSQGYLPPAFYMEDYMNQVKKLGVTGGAVVSGSFQAYDRTYLLNALSQLGRHFVGVTQLPPQTKEKEVLYLHEHGVRAIRFNIKRGGKEQLSYMERLAKNVYEWAGWHTELYVENAMLKELIPFIKDMPAVSIDHLGITEEGFDDLLALAAQGMRVKATGFGRTQLDVHSALQAIHRENPNALLFGTDLPSTRAPRPFRLDDIAIITEALGEKEAKRVFYQNAIRWYRL